jgi:phosphoglycolate phosphatase-like HAD superfamily hydrolase
LKSKVSSLGYVNRIQENILSIKKKELAPLYEEIKSADCIICSGSGRSLYSLNAAMSQIALATAGWRNKIVLTPDDPGFPGKSMYDAAPDFERRYKKTLLLMNSGSGFSEDPLVMAQDLAKYIDEKKSNHFSMGLLTSATETRLRRLLRRMDRLFSLKEEAN